MLKVVGFWGPARQVETQRVSRSASNSGSVQAPWSSQKEVCICRSQMCKPFPSLGFAGKYRVDALQRCKYRAGSCCSMNMVKYFTNTW